MTISKVGLLHHICAMIKVQQDHLQQLSTYRVYEKCQPERDRLKKLEDLHDELLAETIAIPQPASGDGSGPVGAAHPAGVGSIGTLRTYQDPAFHQGEPTWSGLQTALASSTMPEDQLSCIRCAIAEKVELINTCKDEGTLDYLRGGLIDLIQLEFDTLKKAGAPTTTLSVDVDTSQLESALDDIASGMDKLRSYPGAGR